MKRFLAAIALLWLFVTPSQAQQTKPQITSSIQTCFPDNSVGAITPAIVRSCLQNFSSSWQQFAGVNTQTGATYTVQQSDYGQLISISNAGSITVTLPQAIGSFATFNTYVANGGSTTVTLSPVTSLINGSSTLSLSPGQTIWVVSDGTNYHAVPFSQPPSGIIIPVVPVTASTLQTAINQATSAACGTVLIPAGNWNISTSGGSITIPSGCVTIQGSGGASAGGVTGGTVLTTTSAANDLFSVTSTGFVRFTSFSITSSVTRNAGTSGITFNESSLCQGTSRKIVDHMSIDAQSIHINIQSACHATIFDNYLTSATQSYIVYTQPDTSDAGDNVIAFNEMWDVLGTAGATEGVLWKAGSGLRIIGNRFLGSYGTGLHILFSKTSGNDGAMLVSDNTFEVQTAYGIHLECSAGASGAGTKIGQMIFHNNFVQSIEPGLNAGFAIEVCGGSPWVQGGEFSGNTIQSTVTAGFNAIIRNDGGDQFQITNNVVYSSGGANSGIRVTGNSTNTLVADNTMPGVAAANRYALNTSTVVRDNVGMPAANLPSSVAAGSQIFATDGVPGTAPITNGGSGAFAVYINGAWQGLSASSGASFQPQGRLTLQANTPVMITSQTNQTTLRYDCYHGGNLVWVFNTSADVPLTIASCEITTAMQNSGTGVLNTTSVFDALIINSSGAKLCIPTNGSGGGWASDTAGSNTARGTGYSQLDFTTRPYVTNKNSITHCYNGATDFGPVGVNQGTYVGTIYTNAAGQVSYTFGASASGGTAGLFGVWNMYNRVTSTSTVTDSGTGYSYTSSTVRQARASAGNQNQFVIGVQEDGVNVFYGARATTAAATSAASQWGLGFDSTTAYGISPSFIQTSAAVAMTGANTSSGTWNVGVGIHTLSANENGDNSNATTFDGVSTNTLNLSIRN